MAQKSAAFCVTLSELRDLMQLKSQEARDRINETYCGLIGLAQDLRTDLTNGLDGEDKADLKRRADVFGRNQIPAKPSKSIFRLAFEAVQDTTLMMLIVCAAISIALSFYSPSVEQLEQNHDDEFNKPEQPQKPERNLEWIEGVAILVAVVVVVFVTAFNDWRKEKQFRGLKEKIEHDQMTSVIRNGNIMQIPVSELVVGDICYIKYGDLIPADGVVVQASDLMIDESSLTGETDLIKKNLTDNMIVLSGTHVMEGSGKFMVIAVGLNSQSGIIMTLLGAADDKGENEKEKEKKEKKSSKAKIAPKDGTGAEQIRMECEHEKADKFKRERNKDKNESVLEAKLAKLAMLIGYTGMIAAAFTLLILILRLTIQEFVIAKKPWSNIYIKYFISYLIQAITVIVVAVPEGLPLAVTLALAFAVRRMTNDNNLVRHLDACETMGNATTICSDKTGTLTTNRMTVVQCWIGEEHFEKLPDKKTIHEKIRDLIYKSISINSNYTSMIEIDHSAQPGTLPKQSGNKTECGLLGFVKDLGGDFVRIRADYPSDSFTKVYTFNSARKMMSTILKPKDGQNQNGYRIYSKGASEMVLSKCKYLLDKNGKVVRATKAEIDEIIRNVVEKMAYKALRTICVAYRDFKPLDEKRNDSHLDAAEKESIYYYDNKNMPNWDDENDIINDLTCICLVGIEDPVRDEVPEAIMKCQKSGVVVRMVTGDNINTATSIALKCGIVKPGDDYLILESKEFNKRIRDQSGEVRQYLLDRVWPRLRVLARSSPQDKYILVNGIVESKLSANREVVAVTGDGTNDGPALKRADVGFAMGIQGTEVAKEASDIILTDDNFSSIVKAMMWGRNVYDAIAKFLQFQLTANISAGVLSVVCAAVIQVVPLKAIQMLWVNLVMDTFASLALATEPPTEDLLDRKPYGRKKALISYTILKNIIGHSFYQLFVLFALIFFIDGWIEVDSMTKYSDLHKLKEPSVHFTIVFNTFVLMTLFNEINCRKIHNERNVFAGVHKNLFFMFIWSGCFISQVLIVNFGGIVFGVVRLEWDHWMWSLSFGIGSLIWGQIITTIPDSVIKFAKMKFCFCCLKYKRWRNSKSVEVEDDEELELEEINTNITKLSWVRSTSRIQSQLRVIKAFRLSLSSDAKKSYSINRSMLSVRSQSGSESRASNQILLNTNVN